MVLESILNPVLAENKRSRMLLIGFLYSIIAGFMGLLVFSTYASMLLVFFVSLASVPIMMNIIQLEESKDIRAKDEKSLLKEHSKALTAFMFLFLGTVLGVVLLYTVLPNTMVEPMFDAQVATLNAIRGEFTANAISQSDFFFKIFFNNLKVLFLSIIFSFIFGAGAIFIMTWNASVIGTAIGSFIRSNLASASELVGLSKTAVYFHTISIGLLRYSIHGIPEILAYFVGALAGGVISVAIMKGHYKTKKFDRVIIDASELIMIAVLTLVVAGLLEVYVTPLIF